MKKRFKTAAEIQKSVDKVKNDRSYNSVVSIF